MKRLTLPLLTLLLAAAILLSLYLGKYRVPLTDILAFAGWKFFGHDVLDPGKSSLLANILVDIRLPR
ncbi:MAG: hypothetical protein PHI97_17985, partial [Desulfobulbus sp.]|nr:hypothetical protein [Desulfobulbus sp.]